MCALVTLSMWCILSVRRCGPGWLGVRHYTWVRIPLKPLRIVVQALQDDAPAADAAPAADVAAASAQPAAEGAPAGQVGDLAANAANSAAAGIENMGFRIENSQPCKHKLADGKYTPPRTHLYAWLSLDVVGRWELSDVAGGGFRVVCARACYRLRTLTPCLCVADYLGHYPCLR